MEAAKETRRTMSYRHKFINSCAVWFCTFSLGLGISFLPTSLLELSLKFQTDIPTISRVFSAITVSFLFGAILSGVAYNYLNRQLVSAILLILMGVGTALFPLSPSLFMFFIVAVAVGFCAAGYDTAQIVWIIEMWGSNAAAYIQAQHFCFALGTFISPLLVKPFLMERVVRDSETKHLSNISIFNTLSTATENPDSLKYSLENSEYTNTYRLFIPYLIGGLVAICGGIFLIVLYCVRKYEKPIHASRNELQEGISQGLNKGCNSRKVVLVFLSALFLGGYQGMELCTLQFLSAFTQFIKLKLSQPDAALILSGLTGAFTIGRGIGIFISLRILPEILLTGNFILIVIGNTILMYLSDESAPFLWTSAILLGIGFSTVFPSFYGYIEKHLKISNVVGGLMIVAGGLVSSLYPIIIGTYIQQNPFVLMYTNYFSLTICFFTFVTIYFINRNDRIRNSELNKESDIQNQDSTAQIPLKQLKNSI